MNKKLTPLQALNNIANIEMKEQYKIDKGGFAYRVVSDEYSKELKVIETALKALEIIKEKRVDVCYFMNCRTLEEYNDDVLASYAYDQVDAEQRMLTQEEYNFLKEALK